MILGFIGIRVENFLDLGVFGFFGSQGLLGFFVFFRFRVYEILGFRVQNLWFVWVFNVFQGLFQGLQHLGFLKVQGVGFLWVLGFRLRVQDLGLRVFLGLGFQVMDFTQFFMVQGFGFFMVLQVQGLGLRFLLCFLGFSIYDLGLYRVQGLEFFRFRCF